MRAMKHGMIWVVVGMGLAMLLSVGVLGSEESVSAQDVAADPVLVGAGDIASCTSGNDEKTAALLAGINGTVATLGDNAYDSGSEADYRDCYNPPSSWGLQFARTKPSVGNHEYYTAGASGYFGYFGNTASPTESGCTVNCKGYYSYDLGSWHVVVLNSNCDKVGGCDASSPQGQWLQSDLAAHPETTNSQCTLAYFHHPRFSSSGVGNNSAMVPFWKALYDAGADVVLNGHAHNYERFAPQDFNGNADPAYGIRQFIVGTGGKSLNSFSTIRPNSEVRLTDDTGLNVTDKDGYGKGDFGVIQLTLHPGSYEWKFVQIDGMDRDPGSASLDRDPGSASCHSAPPISGPPSITKTDPGTNATGVATTTNVTAFFSKEMDSTTINGKTFKLFKKGSTTKIAAPDPTYDAATKTATLDPTNSLQSGVTYKAVVTTGAKDSVGNPLPQQYKWFFTTVR